MSEETRRVLETINMVLLRCWLIGFVLQLVLIAAVAGMPEFIPSVHASIFGFTAQESNMITANYAGLFKFGVGVFFFIPWLAIRMVLKKQVA